MLNKFAAPIDYLLIGHVTCDLTPWDEKTLGGTVSYAALTAKALNLRPGILTTFGDEISIGMLDAIPIAGIKSDHTTTFRNTIVDGVRHQQVFARASDIHPYMLPETWRNPSIVHLAPVVDEIDLDLLRIFPNSLICLTPQGWMRSIDKNGNVRHAEWLESRYILERADAAVISLEDVSGDEKIVESLAEASRIFVVTESEKGCRLYQNGERLDIPAVITEEIETTGAGDIFAAVFFSSLFTTEDPILSAKMAVRLATRSITRSFLDGIPTQEEIYQVALEVNTPEPTHFAK